MVFPSHKREKWLRMVFRVYNWGHLMAVSFSQGGLNEKRIFFFYKAQLSLVTNYLHECCHCSLLLSCATGQYLQHVPPFNSIQIIVQSCFLNLLFLCQSFAVIRDCWNNIFTISSWLSGWLDELHLNWGCFLFGFFLLLFLLLVIVRNLKPLLTH